MSVADYFRVVISAMTQPRARTVSAARNEKAAKNSALILIEILSVLPSAVEISLTASDSNMCLAIVCFDNMDPANAIHK